MKFAWAHRVLVLVALTGVALGRPVGSTSSALPNGTTQSGDASWQAHRGGDACSPALLPKPTVAADARDRHQSAPAEAPASACAPLPEQFTQPGCHASPPVRAASNARRSQLCQWLI